MLQIFPCLKVVYNIKAIYNTNITPIEKSFIGSNPQISIEQFYFVQVSGK